MIFVPRPRPGHRQLVPFTPTEQRQIDELRFVFGIASESWARHGDIPEALEYPRVRLVLH